MSIVHGWLLQERAGGAAVPPAHGRPRPSARAQRRRRLRDGNVSSGGPGGPSRLVPAVAQAFTPAKLLELAWEKVPLARLS